MLVGVEAPEVSSSLVGDFLPRSAYPSGMLRGRPQSLSKRCTRRLTASAALPLPGAAEPQRSATGVRHNRTVHLQAGSGTRAASDL